MAGFINIKTNGAYIDCKNILESVGQKFDEKINEFEEKIQDKFINNVQEQMQNTFTNLENDLSTIEGMKKF